MRTCAINHMGDLMPPLASPTRRAPHLGGQSPPAAVCDPRDARQPRSYKVKGTGRRRLGQQHRAQHLHGGGRARSVSAAARERGGHVATVLRWRAHTPAPPAPATRPWAPRTLPGAAFQERPRWPAARGALRRRAPATAELQAGAPLEPAPQLPSRRLQAQPPAGPAQPDCRLEAACPGALRSMAAQK